MDTTAGIKNGLFFVWNVFVLIISLILWRILFSLFAAVLIIGVGIPFGVAFAASNAVGLPNTASLITGLMGGFILNASIGSAAVRYGYECPKLDVSFNR